MADDRLSAYGSACHAALKLFKQGKTLVLKVRYGDFTTLTKRMTLTEPTREAERINRSARQIFQEIESTNTGIRLLGVTMTNFVDHTELPLVEEKEND